MIPKSSQRFANGMRFLLKLYRKTVLLHHSVDGAENGWRIASPAVFSAIYGTMKQYGFPVQFEQETHTIGETTMFLNHVFEPCFSASGPTFIMEELLLLQANLNLYTVNLKFWENVKIC